MSKVKRALLVVLDGVGAGANPDAHAYGDDGASSLEHCAKAIGGLALPNLGSIGLGVPLTAIAAASAGLAGILVIWIALALINVVWTQRR